MYYQKQQASGRGNGGTGALVFGLGGMMWVGTGAWLLLQLYDSSHLRPWPPADSMIAVTVVSSLMAPAKEV